MRDLIDGRLLVQISVLEVLKLSYVDATYDEIVSILCSNQVLILKTLLITIKPHPGLDLRIKDSNPSVVHCLTAEG